MEDQERGNHKPKLGVWEREVNGVKRPTIMLPHHLVEKILEKLPVESLIKFKCVSKEWKLTMMSQYFKERQMMFSQRSHDPNILFVQTNRNYWNAPAKICVNTLTLRSSVFVKSRSYYPLCDKSFALVTKSCDGLICMYGFMRWIYVINPSIKWYRSLPLARFQNLVEHLDTRRAPDGRIAFPLLGLGRDNKNGVYKLVWLYNSKVLELDNTTTCEVFSFNSNIWRNVTGSPYEVDYCDNPTYVDGSLHWLSTVTNSKRHIVCFDLSSETFEVSMKIPFTTDGHVTISNMKDRLCISEGKDMKQEIWSLNSGKKWEKTYSIDLNRTSIWFRHDPNLPTQTITTFQKNKILLHSWKIIGHTLIVHDPEQNSYGLAFKFKHRGISIAYFPSLLTV
ncbi:unnamed protein product [Arabidopsis lyrata]|uniref:Predicted protein n=1 Tax=Arabidopsis lyrata subsp. lyrata TaxID=81972 RepID=D7LVQ7_ARALL|nr:predicted protein [Arabidopsis lyrata subsp. lyrata]CAH8268915.1 unnamed protein product [Arabidopsis lyrata]